MSQSQLSSLQAAFQVISPRLQNLPTERQRTFLLIVKDVLEHIDSPCWTYSSSVLGVFFLKPPSISSGSGSKCWFNRLRDRHYIKSGRARRRMSTTQANAHTELENLFAFEAAQHVPTNGRTDILRQGIPQIQQTMLALNGPQFTPSQQPQAPTHQQIPISVMQNPGNPMLTGQSTSPNSLAAGQQRYPGNFNAANPGQRTFLQARNAPPMAGGAANTAQSPHLNAMNHPPLQGMGGMGFMMQQTGNQQQARRVVSQPTMSQLNAMHAQQALGGLNMGMNAQTSMPSHIRSVSHQQQPNMNLRVPPQTSMGLTPEMQMALRQGNTGVTAQNMARSASASQLMNVLSSQLQPGLNAGHPGVSSHPQGSFQSGLPMPQQHQQPQASSSPRPGSHPAPPSTPSVSMNTPNPSHGTPRAQITPDNPMFMNYQSSQYPQIQHNTPRIPSNASFSLGPSSAPLSQHGDDLAQSIPGPLGNPSIPANRSSGFPPTPAQQFADMQAAGETYGAPFTIPQPSQTNPPPRPLSHTTHRPNPSLPQQQQSQMQAQHRSPSHSDLVNVHQVQPQRPQSQPQGQTGRPPSQAGPSQTPHTPQQSLPPNPSVHLGRMGRPTQLRASQSPHQHPPSSGPLPIAPRPPTGPPPPSAVARPPSDDGVAHQSMPTSGRIFPSGLGSGQGLIRLLQFSGVLASEGDSKLQLAYWNAMVKEYFTPKATVKITLWKDNQRNEAKPFEIGTPILPRFFLVTTQSGVKSMTLALDGARERVVGQSHAMIDCVSAVWTYKYGNGYTVTLRGPLTCNVIIAPANPPMSGQPTVPYTLKLDYLQFDATYHDKYIAIDSIIERDLGSPKADRNRNTTLSSGASQQAMEDKKWDEPRITFERGASIPGEPVNAFGIPQATMRCLELAESVMQMTDLIDFSNETKLGPMESLVRYASKIREMQALNPPLVPMAPGNPGFGINGIAFTPAVTLYPGATPTGPPSSQLQPTTSPKGQTASADSPQKAGKSTPQAAASAVSSSSNNAPAGSSAHNTPALANASVKRKQSDNLPAAAATTEAPPAKRTRKRGRTNG